MCMYYSDSFDVDDNDIHVHVCARGVVQNSIADAIDKVSSIGLYNFMPHLSNYDFTHVNQNLLTSL